MHLYLLTSVFVFDLSKELARTYGHALVSFCGPASISRPRGLRGCVQVLVTLGAGLSANCTEINRASNSLEQVGKCVTHACVSPVCEGIELLLHILILISLNALRSEKKIEITVIVTNTSQVTHIYF